MGPISDGCYDVAWMDAICTVHMCEWNISYRTHLIIEHCSANLVLFVSQDNSVVVPILTTKTYNYCILLIEISI